MSHRITHGRPPSHRRSSTASTIACASIVLSLVLPAATFAQSGPLEPRSGMPAVSLPPAPQPVPGSPAAQPQAGTTAAGAKDAGRAPVRDTRQSSVVEFERGDGGQVLAPGRQATLSRTASRGALRRVDIFHGEARIIPIAGKVRRIAIGNGGILSATAVEDGILVLGETSGASTLMVWTEGRVDEYLVTVTEQDTAQTMRFLQSLINEYPGATIERVSERFVLRGALYRSNLEQVNELIKAMPNVVSLLREQEGFAPKKTINFKVQIVELSKTIAEDLGISWDKTFSGPRADFQRVGRATGIYNQLPAPQSGDQLFTPGRLPTALNDTNGGFFLGLATNITSRINLAINNGDATVLAAPEVSTASGGEARFLAGGEVPIVTSSFGGTSVEYKQYGIILNIKPLVDGDNNISAAIETEVSQIDPSVTFGGFPAFLTRKSRSDVSMRPFETLAIAGLVNSSWNRAADKVPLLGDVPVLGRLFRSDNFQNRRTDLVIFVTPDVITPTSNENRALIQKARDIGNRIPPVETDPRYRPPTPASTEVSPLPAPDSPPPPVPVPQVVPPAAGGPGAPLFQEPR